MLNLEFLCIINSIKFIIQQLRLSVLFSYKFSVLLISKYSWKIPYLHIQSHFSSYPRNFKTFQEGFTIVTNIHISRITLRLGLVFIAKRSANHSSDYGVVEDGGAEKYD